MKKTDTIFHWNWKTLIKSTNFHNPSHSLQVFPADCSQWVALRSSETQKHSRSACGFLCWCFHLWRAQVAGILPARHRDLLDCFLLLLRGPERERCGGSHTRRGVNMTHSIYICYMHLYMFLSLLKQLHPLISDSCKTNLCVLIRPCVFINCITMQQCEQRHTYKSSGGASSKTSFWNSPKNVINLLLTSGNWLLKTSWGHFLFP